MLETNLDLTYTIIWSLALANILGAALCLGLARPVASLTRVPFVILAPLITILILFAAYQATRSLGDLFALGIIGAIGVLFKQANWSRPAFLIGFVLAPGAEAYFYQAAQFQGAEAFMRPGVLIIGALIAASLLLPPLRSYLKKRRQANEPMTHELQEEVAPLALGVIDVVLLVSLLAVAGYTWWAFADLSMLGGIMPRLAIAIIVAACVMEIIRTVIKPMKWQTQTLSQQLIWVAGFFALIGSVMVLGFLFAAAVFCLGFLLVVARMKPVAAVGLAAGVTLFLMGMANLLTLTYPTGMLAGL